jgi:hypothetical protein
MNELEKDFVPPQESLVLKELGFDKPCLMYWNDFGKTSMNRFQLLNNIDEWCQDYIEAPTLSQAFRWFRKKYKLSGLVEIGTHEYSFIIFDEEKDSRKITSSINGTYEEAELACLRKLIEIIKS